MNEFIKNKIFEDSLTAASAYIKSKFADGDPKTRTAKDKAIGLIRAISDKDALSNLLNNGDVLDNSLNYGLKLSGNNSISTALLDNLRSEFKKYAVVHLRTPLEDVEQEISQIFEIDEQVKDSLGSVDASLIDSFEKAQARLRLFLYSLTKVKDGNIVGYGLDASLNKIFTDLKDISDSGEFFNKIKNSVEPFYEQLTQSLLLKDKIENKEDLNNALKFQNLFFTQVGKMNNNFIMIKHSNEIILGESVNKTTLVQVTKEKFVEQSMEKHYGTLKPSFEYVQTNQETILDRLASVGLKLDFSQAKELDSTIEKSFRNTNWQKLDQIYYFIIQGSKKALDKKGNFNERVFKNAVRSNIKDFATLEQQLVETKAVYSIYNANGKPTYTAQNFNGLFKALPGVPIDILNGLKSSFYLPNADPNKPPKVLETDLTTNKLNAQDLLNNYIHYVLHGKTPYTFVADKSTIPAPNFMVTYDRVDENNEVFTTDPSPLKSNTNFSRNTFINYQLKPKLSEIYDYQLGIFDNGYTDDHMVYFKKEGLTKEDYSNPQTKKKLIQEVVDLVAEEALAIENYYKSNGLIETFEEHGPDVFYQFQGLYTIGQIEFIKKAFNDLAYFNDPTKRLYGMSSAKLNIRHDQEYINIYNKLHGTDIQSYTRAIIVNDVFVDNKELGEAYKENNGSNAQGYMAYDSYMFMLRSSGLVDEKVEQLDKIIRTDPDTKSVEKAYRDLGAYVKAIKPQGFGFNEEGVSVFYKLSVIPLIQQITDGKNIDNVRQLMQEKGLDLVIYKSGNKVGTKSVLDLYKNGQYNTDIGKEMDADSRSLHKLDWKWFNIQVETTANKGYTNKGSQSTKVIMLDTPTDLNIKIRGKELDGKDAIVAYKDSLEKRKIQDEVEKIKKNLNLDDDFNLNLGEDYEKSTKRFKSILYAEAISRETPREFQESILALDTYDLIANKYKIEGILLGMLDTTKHKMFGESLVQVSSVGWEAKNKNINKDRALTYKDGKMEVYLPMQYMKYFKDKVTFNKETKIYELNKGVELPAHIAYRIPTQYINAIDRVIVKGFTPGFLSNTVVVPFEITTKTGSDFDVDKLNIFFPTYNEVKNIKYAKAYRKNLGLRLDYVTSETRKSFNEMKDILKLNPIYTELKSDEEFYSAVSTNPKETIKTFNQIKKLYNSTQENKKLVNESNQKLIELYDSLPEDIKEELTKNSISSIDPNARGVDKNLKSAISRTSDYINGKQEYEYDLEGVDNEIIELYSALLEAKQELVMTPNNQETINKVFTEIIEKKGNVKTRLSKLDFLFPMKMILKRFDFMSAKDTLGIQAKNVTSHAISQMYDIEINDVSVPALVYTAFGANTVEIPRLSTLLSAFDSFTDLSLHKFKFNEYSGNNSKKGYISQFLSQTVDATVDVAKADLISYVNFNPETTKVVNLLIRLGIDTREIFHLINNPSVLQYIANKYRNKSGSIQSRNYTNYTSYTKSGKLDIIGSINKPNDLILALYQNLEYHGDMLNTFNNIISYDTKGVGTTVAENLFMNRLFTLNEDKLRAYFKNFDRVFNYEPYLDNGVTIYPKSGDTFIGMFKRLAKNIKNQTDVFFPLEALLRENWDAQIVKIIESRHSLFENIKEFNKMTNSIKSSIIKNRIYDKYTSKYLKNDLYKINTNRKNILINNLIFKYVDGKEIINFFGGSSLSIEESNQYSNYWMEIYYINNELSLQIAIKNYFQFGLINSPFSLYNIIPLQIKKDLGVHELLPANSNL
jgi:hypothetical protein